MEARSSGDVTLAFMAAFYLPFLCPSPDGRRLQGLWDASDHQQNARSAVNDRECAQCIGYKSIRGKERGGERGDGEREGGGRKVGREGDDSDRQANRQIDRDRER